MPWVAPVLSLGGPLNPRVVWTRRFSIRRTSTDMSRLLPRSLRRARNLGGLALATAAFALGPVAMTQAQAASGVSANFDATLGILNIVADDTSNRITVAKGPNSTIIINGGSVMIDGGTPKLDNTILIQV